MFNFLKHKKDEMQEIQNAVETPQPEIVQDYSMNMQQDLMSEILNPKKDSKFSQPIQQTQLPETTQEALDFETIEVRSRPSTKSSFMLATFTDLSALAKRTPIFVYRDRRQNIYFGLVEGKMFYLKK